MARRRYAQKPSKQNLIVILLLVGLTLTTALIFVGLLIKGADDDIQPFEVIQKINPRARIGRAELQLIKQMPPNVQKEEVFKTLGQPLAKLKDLQSKQNGALQQYAYPLAFDPPRMIILLFQSDRLLAYQFAFNGNIPPE